MDFRPAWGRSANACRYGIIFLIMRALYGVTFVDHSFASRKAKQQAILFDGLLTIGLEEFCAGSQGPVSPNSIADIEFIKSRQLIVPAPYVVIKKGDEDYQMVISERRDVEKTIDKPHFISLDDIPDTEVRAFAPDLAARVLAVAIRTHGLNVAPIYHDRLPQWVVDQSVSQGITDPSTQNALRVGLNALPLPNVDCPWETIMDFREELYDKKWGFRRWLTALATKQQTEAEIRDELEWSLNEYTEAMKIHHIKASQSFVDIFVISPLEIIEDLVKFNWSKIAKGALSVKKRKVELKEAEMKAPGRECAYVFDARKRFAGK
jgi:hypothetical protein